MFGVTPGVTTLTEPSLPCTTPISSEKPPTASRTVDCSRMSRKLSQDVLAKPFASCGPTYTSRVSVWIGEGPREDAFDDCEHCGAWTDTEGERDDGQHGERRRLAPVAQRESEVEQK